MAHNDNLKVSIHTCMDTMDSNGILPGPIGRRRSQRNQLQFHPLEEWERLL